MGYLSNFAIVNLTYQLISKNINNMRLQSALYALILLFIASGCSNKTIQKLTWQTSEINAGEFQKDWNTDMQYNSKSKMLYGVSNDDQNLYVSLKVIDPAVKRKIMFTGLTYWINTSGKSNAQMELTFPIEQSKQTKNARMGEFAGKQANNINKSDITKFNEKYLNGMSEIAITGFDGETESRLLGNKSKNGINAILMTDSLHTLYYEVQIPLDMIFENPTDFLTDSTNSFSYGFETGYLKMPPPSRGSKGAGGGGGGRGGGKGGRGGQSGSENSEMRSSMSEMSQPSKISVKSVSLSNKNE